MTYEPENPNEPQPYDAPQPQYAPAGGSYAPQPEYSNYGQQLEPNDKRTFSLWGVITGVVSLVLLSMFFLPGLAAIALSIVGLLREPRGKTMSIWGIVTGGLSLIVGLLLWILVPVLLVAAAASQGWNYYDY